MKSTNHINMEGLGVNQEILKAFKNFKQASILDSSFLQVQHVISNDLIEHSSGFDFNELARREMVQRLGSGLIEKYKADIEETKTQDGIKFSLDLVSMSSRELKHIVEYCIRTMPQNAIEEIRK
jgi:hypothetical protein